MLGIKGAGSQRPGREVPLGAFDAAGGDRPVMFRAVV